MERHSHSLHRPGDPPGSHDLHAPHGAPRQAPTGPDDHADHADHPFDYLLGDDGPLPAPTVCVDVQRWRHDGISAARETVVEEVPVALVYNGISQAVMLATPQDLEDFAVGFSLSERIVGDRHDIFDIDMVAHASGIEVRMRIAGHALDGLKRQRRQRTGKTGCGLCGIDSLAQFEADAADACNLQAADYDGNGEVGSHAIAGLQRIAPAAVHAAIASLAARQPIHAETGAAHAAGWAQPDGTLLLVREDVGRHNALDKLIGALARAAIPADTGFAVVTSRASFEMVQKATRAGIGLLAAVSAPTAMAVRMADAAGLTLTGFVRGDRHVVYSHPGRLGAS